MNTRKADRIDYNIYHKTGKKVLKEGGQLKMERSQLSIQELKIVEDIDHSLNIYNLSELVTEEEIKEAIEEISTLSKDYRHIHIDLKNLLPEEYGDMYPKYAEKSEILVAYVKSAKLKLRNLNDDVHEKMNSIEKKSVQGELDLLRTKVEHVNAFIDVSIVNNVKEIDQYIFKMEGYVNEFFDLSAKMRHVCLVTYEKDFEKDILNSIFEIQQDIKMAKILKQQIADVKQRLKKRDFLEKEQLKNVTDAENLQTEICYRFKILSKKYDPDLDNLDDYQILEIYQDKTLDIEFNDILEKVTSLATLASVGGDTVKRMVTKVSKTRDRIALKREKFLEDTRKIVLERDITPEKLKNASELAIDLPKFSGYDGNIDFYTFKSEYRKLIEPRVQKKYRSDYLKRNYLNGRAFTLVEKETDYEKIWEKLCKSFGNSRLLLHNKLQLLDKIGGIWKFKGDEKIGGALAKLTNIMKDLSTLAAEHNIEGQLYEGGGLEKILSLIGETRHRKFRSETLCFSGGKKQEWQKLEEFLKKELCLREKLTLDYKSAEMMGLQLSRDVSAKSTKAEKKNEILSNTAHNAAVIHSDKLCHICNQDGHTKIVTLRGNTIIPYYVCEKFVKMSPTERLSTLKSKKLCCRCLYPGAVTGPKHKCRFTNFCCPSHEKNEKIHILLCEEHKRDNENVSLLEKFKDRFIKNCTVPLPDFVNSLSYFSEMVSFESTIETSFGKYKCLPEVTDSAIFQLQTIEIEGVPFNVMFDSGCGSMIVKKAAAEKLLKLGRAKKILSGPLEFSGVGDKQSVCEDGLYNICIPLHTTGKDPKLNATLTGICLPKITCDFPVYDLTCIEKDIREQCKNVGNGELISRLPRLPPKVGGDTDILIGAKYLKLFPKEIFELDTGLRIYKSRFEGLNKSRGVLSGPHKDFAKFEKNSKGAQVAYFTALANEYNRMWRMGNDVPLLGDKVILAIDNVEVPICCELCDVELIQSNSLCESYCANNSICVMKRAPKNAKRFEKIEASGTEVNYRCVDCRTCKQCKNGPRIESISIQDEIEQNLIEKCVNVDIQLGISMAKLPFLVNPDTRLAPNEHVAIKVFNNQIRMLNTNLSDKKSVLEFEQKLQDLGYVNYVSELCDDERDLIMKSDTKYFIPWRPIWKLDSISTPCRLAFDASMGTKSGCSLNSLLAKGANSLNNLQGIAIRWTTHKYAYHTDVQKMYNKVLLHPSHWRYQLYLFSRNLDIGDKPEWKVIKTLIYGVRPSGSLAECALRRTVQLCKDEYPLAYIPITRDTYMDDCASGSENLEQMSKTIEQLQIAVGKGGFTFKGITESGNDPPDHLTEDGKSISVLGLKWFPKGDFIKLNIGEINFNHKKRGRKQVRSSDIIPEILTMRDCVSRASEVFDCLGWVSPILAGIKLDISTLHKRCKGWGDPIPSELKEIWIANFQAIDDLREIKFKRAVVPYDAENLDIETICAADASQQLVCATVHARFLRRDGSYSCQLIFARTKVVHDLTMPRAELVAAVLNASTGHLVRTSLKDNYKNGWYITDSQVVLHWINCLKAALKLYVRNRVVEITFLADRLNWYYVKSEDMVADLGTRKGVKIEQIGPESDWIRGLPWMRKLAKYFPLTTVEDIILSAKVKSEVNKEKVLAEGDVAEADRCFHANYVPKEVGERYKFSKYLVNPNKYRFRTVVRIVALVFLFIKKLAAKMKRKFAFLNTRDTITETRDQYVVCLVQAVANDKFVNVSVIELPQKMLDAAKNYYFRKAALEVQKFVDPNKYKNISVLKDKILYFTGRILSTQKVDGRFSFSDAMLDLSEATFCVPITDALSPIAYAIVSETHWYDPDVKHAGVEATLRYAQNTAHVIDGRRLVKILKKACIKCRILHKKGVEIAMGPIRDENLKVAPPFYYAQVDLCGIFKAYSPANKRATLKVWFAVFCCSVTGAVDCRVMENYNTDSFVLAFIRFSCRFGYPKMLIPDEGSQLVKACENMILTFSNLSHKLSTEYGVEFKTCPVGAHYVHGKVERKIQQIKGSLEKVLNNNRLSILQWETLGQQISNSINNLPIGLGNKTEMLDALDILTPNRLLLGRNNSRSPTMPLEISGDFRGIIESNSKIFETWFKEWLVSYVPSLVQQPKWFQSDRSIRVGDIVLFLKAEKEFEKEYQYGIIITTVEGRDGLIRTVEIQYQNHSEKTKRTTKRCVRDIVVIHPVEDIGISAELNDFAKSVENKIE